MRKSHEKIENVFAFNFVFIDLFELLLCNVLYKFYTSLAHRLSNFIKIDNSSLTQKNCASQ